MSDNIDLTLILSLVQKASRDAEAALAATERLAQAILPRLGALEGRFSALEARTAGIETTLDVIARGNHRIEGTLAAILARLPEPSARG